MSNSSRVDATPRAMWLLNHTAARRFEIPMLKKAGIKEIFLPKIYPNDPNFRSASVDFSEDDNLTIPADDLRILNETNWYRGGGRAAWKVANKYFDLVFFILYYPESFWLIQRRFEGAKAWRTYGLSHGNTYSKVISEFPAFRGVYGAIRNMGETFWFAEGYPHLHEIEDDFLASRAVFLPLGMNGASNPKFDEWRGTDRRILFVCPDIGYNHIYQEIYKDFKRNFGDLPYVIGGAQPIQLDDPHILGYLPAEEHARNMRGMRVMFYHSSEPRHIHFHPFEAVAAGMPLVFMSGGILDRFGGKRLPGRCKTIAEARSKIERILGGDQRLIDNIRKTQPVLLNEMKPENCVGHWVNGISTILTNLSDLRTELFENPKRTQRIAILATPQTLADAVRLSRVIKSGADESVEVVIGVESGGGDERRFSPGRIVRGVREFQWEPIDPARAKRTFLYDRSFKPAVSFYSVPDDGINYFGDCDLWILLSRDIDYPVLPMRPFVVRVKTKKKRTEKKRKAVPLDRRLRGIEHSADAIIVETADERDQVIGLEGVEARKVHLLADLKTLERSLAGRPNPSSVECLRYWEVMSECL